MTSLGHTPGTWQVLPGGTSTYVTAPWAPGGGVVVAQVGGHDDSQIAKNACLIALAPEMAEHMRNLIANLETMIDWQQASTPPLTSVCAADAVTNARALLARLDTPTDITQEQS